MATYRKRGSCWRVEIRLKGHYLPAPYGTKAGGRWETIRLRTYLRDPLSKVDVDQLDTTHMVNCHDNRLNTVSASSVNRDLNLMSAIFTKARKEWKCIEVNPISDLDKPPRSKLSDRRSSDSSSTSRENSLKFIF